MIGGATGDDLVEFLEWEDPKQWNTLGKLNRGRGEFRQFGTSCYNSFDFYSRLEALSTPI